MLWLTYFLAALLLSVQGADDADHDALSRYASLCASGLIGDASLLITAAIGQGSDSLGVLIPQSVSLVQLLRRLHPPVMLSSAFHSTIELCQR